MACLKPLICLSWQGVCLGFSELSMVVCGVSTKYGMWLVINAACLLFSIRSIINVPGLVVCLQQFLVFHMALLLVSACTPLPASSMQSVQFLQLVCNCAGTASSHRPWKYYISCLLQAGVYLVFGAGVVGWVVARNKEALCPCQAGQSGKGI